MPDSRLRAAAYAAGVGAILLLPICGGLVYASLHAPIKGEVNWWAAAALAAYVVIAVSCTYLTRRGVNLGRGLL